MLKKLRLETTAPFQGLPELVAYEEGLFEAEGLEIEWIPRGQSAPAKADRNVTDWNEVSAFGSHGSAAEGGQACMYNACEWGNYRRVDDSRTNSRQVGRRAIMVYGAIAVGPQSEAYTLQQLANVPVGVPYHAGTHYLAILLLEGFLPRDAIKTCLAPNGARKRFEALMSGDLDATTLTEPYITVAERAGCRVLGGAFFHGTEVATPEVDGLTYLAFNRAVREAVARINADKPKYPPVLHRPAQGRSPRRRAYRERPAPQPASGGEPVSHSRGRAPPHLRVDEELEHAEGRHPGGARGRGGAAACPRIFLNWVFVQSRKRAFLRDARLAF